MLTLSGLAAARGDVSVILGCLRNLFRDKLDHDSNFSMYSWNEIKKHHWALSDDHYPFVRLVYSACRDG
jgi:hypothetical protein